MEERYIRNQFHVDKAEQQFIKNFKVLIAGCGIGSYIAECLLRLGFECLTLVDGDVVERSNLNRQNYTEDDLGRNKAVVLQKRLLAIHSKATIEAIPHYITPEGLPQLNIDHEVVINALDFSGGVPHLLDELCCNRGIPVVHPYNLGWAGFVTVITKESQKMASLQGAQKVFELSVGDFIVQSLNRDKIATGWLVTFLQQYKAVALHQPPPQVSPGLSLLSGMVSHITFNIATGRGCKVFPEYYYLSLHH